MQSPPSNLRIEQLCGLAQSGDKSAEQELLLLLTDSFRLFAKHAIGDHAEVEDVAQDALTVVIQKYKGTVFESSFCGWAHNVLRNTVSSHLQTKATRARLTPRAAGQEPIANYDPDDEFLRMVLTCLDRVARSNRRFARVLNLNYQGFTAMEISARLGIKTEYLYVVLARARSMLEACLDMTES